MIFWNRNLVATKDMIDRSIELVKDKIEIDERYEKLKKKYRRLEKRYKELQVEHCRVLFDMEAIIEERIKQGK